jgi:hypothetical protein
MALEPVGGTRHPIYKQGIEKRLVEDGLVDLSNGSSRVYAVLTPQEAAYLRTLLAAATPGANVEVNKASLDTRLGFAANGDVPQSGEARYYQ